jgi:lactose/L-arabinose transport system substrate-binding protein
MIFGKATLQLIYRMLQYSIPKNEEENMERNLFAFLAILCLLSPGLLWGGGEQEGEGAAVPAEPVQIEYLSWLAQDQDYNRYIDEKFESKHPNIKVTYIKMGAWDLHDKLIVSLTAGAGAGDVVSMVGRRFNKYASTGRLVDLTSHVKQYKSDFTESLWNSTMHNGKVYGMATDESPALFFYRKDIFQKAGYETIDTWGQFVDAGKKLKQNGHYIAFRQYPSVNEGLNDMTIYLFSMGGNIYSKDGKVVDPNPEFEKLLDFFYQMHFEEGITTFLKFYSQEFWAAYKDDSVASLPAASWISSFIKRTLPEQNGKWAMDHWPKWSDSAPAVTGKWGGSVVAVPEYSKHHAEAVELIKWLTTTTEGQLMYALYNQNYPSYLPALKDPYFREGDPYYNGQNMFELSDLPIPDYYQFDWAETAQIVGKQLDLMWEEKQDADETYRNIVKNLKSELGR